MGFFEKTEKEALVFLSFAVLSLAVLISFEVILMEFPHRILRFLAMCEYVPYQILVMGLVITICYLIRWAKRT